MKLVIEFDMSDDTTSFGDVVACTERTLNALKEHISPDNTAADIRRRTMASEKFTVMCEITRPNVDLADGAVFGRVVVTDAAMDTTAYSLKQRDYDGQNRGVIDTTTGKRIKA